MKNLRYIKDQIYKYKYRYIFGVLFLLAVDALQLVLPWVLGRITDLLKAGALNGGELARYAMYIAVIAVGIALFRFLWRYLVLGVSRLIEQALRTRFYEQLQSLSANYYNSHKTGDLMAHATNDINNVTEALGQGFVFAVDSATIPVVAVIMMLRTAGPGLAIASFSPLFILGMVIVMFVKVVHNRVMAMQEAFSSLTETARENFSGIRVVKSFVQELLEIEKFRKANLHNKNMNLRFIRLMSLMFPTVMTFSALSFAIALWYGGAEVIRGNISLGDFIAFNSYLGLLTWPIAALGWVVSIFQRGFVSLERINLIMDEVPEIRDNKSVSAITHINGDICFKNLTFVYPGSNRPALEDISLTIERGKTLAVVGRTGSGKTTLANLIPRLFNSPPGTLYIDGNDINDIPLHLLRSSIGYVPQDTFLFSATIGENIDFFQGRDKESVMKSSTVSRIYDNIMEFPGGFDTLVGERGVTLSGGQKQRISIARAVHLSPSILILDDCLSAVDTHTEEEILSELKKIMEGRTSIIISHRISTIKDADEIIVLENGKIVERGTHESLLELKGIYYGMYQKQLLSEQIEGVE